MSDLVYPTTKHEKQPAPEPIEVRGARVHNLKKHR